MRLIGFVGGQGPEVRKVGDQTVAQVSLGIRPKSGNTNELSWVVCDFWNHEVRVLFTSLLYQRCHLCHFTSILCSRHTGGRCYPCSWLTRQSLKVQCDAGYASGSACEEGHAACDWGPPQAVQVAGQDYRHAEGGSAGENSPQRSQSNTRAMTSPTIEVSWMPVAT